MALCDERARDDPRGDEPVLPDYAGACLTNVVPTLLGARRDGPPAWFPSVALEAPQVVLLVLDGLGWQQLRAQPRAHAARGEHAGRADHLGRAVDDRDRAHVDHDRPVARGARSRRLPHRRRTATC